MADIKTKGKATIKKLDNAVVKTQKIKGNIVEIKDKTKEIDLPEEQSANEYVYNRIKSGETIVKNKTTYNFNKYGRKSIQNTKANIKNIKEKIDNYKLQKSIKNNQKIHNVKAPKYIKGSNFKYKGNIRSVANKNKILVNSKQIVQNKAIKGKQNIKKAVNGIKNIFKGTKALMSLIMAGGFVSVIVILLICMLGAVMSIFNWGGNDDTKSMWNSSMVYVAKSQLGVTGGDPYWSWYGFTERVEWCAVFVSWCADQTGYIENGEIPKYSVCTDGINYFKEKEKWQDRSETYIPKQSDIIFFDWEVDGVCDHTGIVESVDLKSNKVKTIEGNSSDAVKELEYNLSDERIVGYGTPEIKE